MHSPPALAWQQLVREKGRFLVAVVGVAFAVLLMLMQLGFKDSLFESTVLLHRRFNADLVLISPQSSFLSTMQFFPRRRLYQALTVPGVASASPIYIGVTYPIGWRNPYTGTTRNIYVIGFSLDDRALDMPPVIAQAERLRAPDAVLFDALGRPEYGPIAQDFRSGRPISTEVGRRKISVAGLFDLGTSFAVDGTLITSDVNFLRLFPARPWGLIDVGLIRLTPGADPLAVKQALARALPADVQVLTKPEYIDREIRYWAGSTPIGFVFAFGSVMGFIVGSVIVYQILFADVADHLPEYATLKAIGFTNRYLKGVVLSQAVILAVLGYLPGLLVSAQLYRLTVRATSLPMRLEAGVSLMVLGLTILMCGASGLLALRKVQEADPADIF
jgi:putative ABC transport system permease protein